MTELITLPSLQSSVKQQNGFGVSVEHEFSVTSNTFFSQQHCHAVLHVQ